MIQNQPWYVDSQVFQTFINSQVISNYTLADGGSADCQKVVNLYQKSPVHGWQIGGVQIINNPALNRQFEGRVMVLNERANSPAFTARWQYEGDLSTKQHIHSALQAITTHFPSTYQHVQFYPAFHGTKSSRLDSICKTGYANLATTDNGFFGKGIYSGSEGCS